MVFHHNTQKLWMLQDKGNASELYVYSPEGTFEKTLHINNQKNTDWEDLSDETIIYTLVILLIMITTGRICRF